MPNRPGLDDDDEFKALVKLWVDGAAELDRRLDGVFANIERETRRLRSLPAGADKAKAVNAVRRLGIEGRRITQLQDVAEAIIDDGLQGTRAYINGGGLHRLYTAGAGQVDGFPFAFTVPHKAAVEVFARDLFDDVLVMTEFVDADSKAWVRRVGRQLAAFKVTGGTTVREQARTLERDMRREFKRVGMSRVVYADGSRHSFGEYASMLLRTKTSTAYNMGTMNHSAQVGIQYVEILDGANCGLVSHHDPQTANGLIVPIEVGMAYPLSHPNCRRAIAPRPDVTARNAPSAPSVQSAEARADQTAFEDALRQQAAAAAGRQRRGRGARAGGRGRPSRRRPGAVRSRA